MCGGEERSYLDSSKAASYKASEELVPKRMVLTAQTSSGMCLCMCDGLIDISATAHWWEKETTGSIISMWKHIHLDLCSIL